MALKDYEDEVLMRMFDETIIGHDYLPVERVASKINWMEIQHQYTRARKRGFRRVLRHLANKGYVDQQGKSGNTASLSRLGVAYVMGKTRNTSV